MWKESEARHLDELAAIGYEGEDLEPLRALEERAHKAAEDYCNVEGFDFDRAERGIWAEIEELFGGDAPAGFFVNGEPRGYALKLREGTGALSYRDSGGFEILAPELEN